MHWQYIINLYSSNPTPQESSCSHDLALYSLSSSFHFHANGNPERFFSLSWVIVDIHSEKLMLIPSKYVRWQMSTFYYEAFCHLFVCYIFQPLAVNHPHLLHSSMRLHHSDPLYPYHPVLPQWLLVVPVFLILSTPHPVPTLLTNTEEPDILQTLKSKALLSSRHRPLRFSREPCTLAHVRGHYYSVQTRSLSQLRKHYIVTMWKKNEVSAIFH